MLIVRKIVVMPKPYRKSVLFERWFEKRFGERNPNDPYIETWQTRYMDGLDTFVGHMDTESLRVLIDVLQDVLPHT